MRIAICALSAVLLSGCSWLGMGGNGHHGGKHAANGYYGSQQGGQQARSYDPCQIMSPTQPIPRGCAPSQVTVGAQGGFPQQPNFGAGQYTNSGYGSHAGSAGNYNAQAKRGPRLRKPKLRGTLSAGFEKSIGGSYLDYNKTSPVTGGYTASDYDQRNESGSPTSGSVTTTTWTVDDATVSTNSPTISNDDVHSTPFRVAGGLEYIMSPRTTVFANAGYSVSEGKSIGGTSYEGDVVQEMSVQSYDGAGAEVGDPVPTAFVRRNEIIANRTLDFSDMRRLDLEIGGRRYFNPILAGSVNRAITPFVGASAGVSHYNKQSVKGGLDQLFYSSTFDPPITFYEANTASNQTEIYGSQFVPSGAVTAGLEWQMTPKTAMAFETGVRVEGGRKYSNGNRTEANVAIPVTIRGSYNF